MIKREELVNSIEYWQEQHEILCYRENIKPTLQLADKKQMIDKVCDNLVASFLKSGMSEENTIAFVSQFRKAMEE